MTANEGSPFGQRLIPERIESAAALSQTDPEPIEYDIDGMMPSDDAPTLLFGPPASLKSWICKHICDVVVRGKPFLGRYPVRRRERALYLNLDAGAKTFRNRVRRVSDAVGFDFVSLSASEFDFDTLRELMDTYRGAFVVIDCLSAIYSPDRSKDPAFAMREFVDDLRALFTQYECGGIVIDHPHRPKERGELGDYHGSIQKEAAFRSMWHIVAEPADDPSHARRTKITCRKLSEGHPFSPVLVTVDFGGERVTFTNTVHDPAAQMDELETRLLEWANAQVKPFSKNAAEKGVSGGRATDKRIAFDRLAATGKLEATGGKRGGADLYLATSSSSGTRWDEVDEAMDLGPPGTSSTSSPSIGDEVPGTRSGTKSEDEDDLGLVTR